MNPPAQDQAAAWRDDELGNPHARADKAGKVRAMFAAIAASYDLNNRLHSLGLDRAWRRRAVQMAAVRPGNRVLDVACGTGDLTQIFASTRASRVTGVDFTPEMLTIAERKRAKLGPEAAAKIAYEQGDAMALTQPDASFDVVSIAFGLRNVSDPARAIAEFARVLRPGGRLIVLEFGSPPSGFARLLNRWYCERIMPTTATLISGDKSGAYKYLPASVRTFASREELMTLIARSGFERVEARAMTMGICVCYKGVRKA